MLACDRISLEAHNMELYQKILIPTDGSEYSKIAVAHGLKLAKATGAKVTALNVIDEMPYVYFADSIAINNLTPRMEAEGKAAVDYVQKEGEKIGVDVATVVKRGHPADEIIEAAKGYDLVVMGTLGHSGLSHLLVGSVAERVVRFSTCPVLLVRSP